MPDLDRLVEAVGGTSEAERLIRKYDAREDARWRGRYEVAQRDANHLAEKLNAALKLANTLREAVGRYGRHESKCPAFHDWNRECTCGMRALQAPVDEQLKAAETHA